MATNWVTIASADLNDYLNGPQVNALRSAALVVGQADPFPNIMGAVVDRIRNRLKPRYPVSATPQTVPPELKQIGCLLILEQMSARIPQLELSEDQRTLIKDAKAELEKYSDPKENMSVTLPTDPAPQDFQTVSKVEVAVKTTRLATRDSTRGL